MYNIVVPVKLVESLSSLGIIPNNRRIDEGQLITAAFLLRKKSAVPEDLKQWIDLTMNKIQINPDKYEAIIDILAFPYGGHNNDKDCVGEFFHPGTDFKEEALPYPPVVHAHGLDVDGSGAAETTVVGETLRRWKDENGGWAKIGIYRDTPYTENIVNAWNRGVLMASSTALLKKLSQEVDGRIDTWLAGEISTITPESGISPCNFLASARARKSEQEIRDIIESQEEPYRSRLEEILESVNEDGEEVPITTNTEPVNQGAEPDDNSGEVDFPEDDTMPFSQEQLAQLGELIDKKLAAVVPPAPTPEPEPAETKNTEGDNRQKGDMAAFLEAKAKAVTATAAVNKQAVTVVDGWINGGFIAPEEREDTIEAFSAAIELDGKRKSGTKAVQAFCNLIEKRDPMKADRLFGFGKSATLGEDKVDKAAVTAMAAAAME